MKDVTINPFLSAARTWMQERIDLPGTTRPLERSVVYVRLLFQAIEEMEKNSNWRGGIHTFSPRTRGKALSEKEGTTKIFGTTIRCKKKELDRGIKLAHTALKREIRKCALGVRKSVEVQKLQDLLRKHLSETKRREVCHHIAEIFESCSSYQEMHDLREAIECLALGQSPLFQLVYKDVDTQTSHRILRAINQNFKKAYLENPSQVQFHYRIYSDIDDTIQPSHNDKKVHISGFYPSVFAFSKQLSRSVPQEILSKVVFGNCERILIPK